MQEIAGIVWACPLAQHYLASPAKEVRVNVEVCCLTTLFWQHRPFTLLGDKNAFRPQWRQIQSYHGLPRSGQQRMVTRPSQRQWPLETNFPTTYVFAYNASDWSKLFAISNGILKLHDKSSGFLGLRETLQRQKGHSQGCVHHELQHSSIRN